MNSDKHYWKEAYKEHWEAASTKEKAIKQLIESQTGFKVMEIGLGAGSTTYIEGNAADNNLLKGDADLFVAEKDCYIEVTGPNIPLPFHSPLWIRPDKIKNTFKKIQEGIGKLHVVCHVLTEKGTNQIKIRIVKLDQLFSKHLDSGSFRVVYPRIRGRQEKYVELPAEHEVIITFEEFVTLLLA